MSSDKSSADSLEPFEVFPEDSSTSGPLRFDPKDWTFVAEKERTEGWQTFEWFPEYIIEETIYQGDSDQWIIISARSCMIAGLPIERTYKVLSGEEAAEWFIDCKGEVPEALTKFMPSRSLTPESLGTINQEQPVLSQTKPAELELTAEVFIEYWKQFEIQWRDISRSAKDLKSNPDALQTLRDAVFTLVQSAKHYGQCSYRIPGLPESGDIGSEWGCVEIPIRLQPMNLGAGELPPPYDGANRIYRLMVPEVRSLAIAVAEIGESKLGKTIVENCCLTAKSFAVRASWVNRSITDSDNEEFNALMYAVAVEKLSQGASDSNNQEKHTKPKWHGKKLFAGNALVTEYRRDAKNQIAILEAFQLGDWADRIDDPLPHPSDSQKLRETVASLNKRQDKIEFRCDGTGAGVLWSMRGRSADDKSS